MESRLVKPNLDHPSLRQATDIGGKQIIGVLCDGTVIQYYTGNILSKY